MRIGADMRCWATASAQDRARLYWSDHVVLVVDRSARGRAVLAAMLEEDPALQDAMDDFAASGFQFLVTLTSNWTCAASCILMARDETALLEDALPRLERQIRSMRRAAGETMLAFAVEPGLEHRLARSIRSAGVRPTHPSPRRLQ